MDGLTLSSSFSDEEIEKNFECMDFFSELVESLVEARTYAFI